MVGLPGPDFAQDFHQRPCGLLLDQGVAGFSEGSDGRVVFAFLHAEPGEDLEKSEVPRAEAQEFADQGFRLVELLRAQISFEQEPLGRGVGPHAWTGSEDSLCLGGLVFGQSQAGASDHGFGILRVERGRIDKSRLGSGQIPLMQRGFRRLAVRPCGVAFSPDLFAEIGEFRPVIEVVGGESDHLAERLHGAVVLILFPKELHRLHEVLSSLSAQSLHGVEFSSLQKHIYIGRVEFENLLIDGDGFEREAFLRVRLSQLVEMLQGLGDIPFA